MKSFGYILFGLAYTLIYFFLALMSTGGGHGNFIVLLPSITWLFNFVALGLLTKLKSEMVRIYFVVMMFVYYGITLLILYPASKDIKMVTHPHAEGILVPAAWYLLGQLIIWALFYREIKNHKISD